jgi:hypothetical protein
MGRADAAVELPVGGHLDPSASLAWAQDSLVRLATQEFAADTIPDSHLTVWPDAGHFGTAKYWRQMLEAVAAGR